MLFEVDIKEVSFVSGVFSKGMRPAVIAVRIDRTGHDGSKAHLNFTPYWTYKKPNGKIGGQEWNEKEQPSQFKHEYLLEEGEDSIEKAEKIIEEALSSLSPFLKKSKEAI